MSNVLSPFFDFTRTGKMESVQTSSPAPVRPLDCTEIEAFVFTVSGAGFVWFSSTSFYFEWICNIVGCFKLNIFFDKSPRCVQPHKTNKQLSPFLF